MNNLIEAVPYACFYSLMPDMQPYGPPQLEQYASPRGGGDGSLSEPAVRRPEDIPRPPWTDVTELFIASFPDEQSVGRRIFPAAELAGIERTAAAVEHALGIQLLDIPQTGVYWKNTQERRKLILPPKADGQPVVTIGDLFVWQCADETFARLGESYPKLMEQLPAAFVRDLLVLPHARLVQHVISGQGNNAEPPIFRPEHEKIIRAIVEEEVASCLSPSEAAILSLRYGLYSGTEEHAETVRAQTGYGLGQVRRMGVSLIDVLQEAGAGASFSEKLSAHPVLPTPEQKAARLRREQAAKKFTVHALGVLASWETCEDEGLFSPRLGEALNAEGQHLDDKTFIRSLRLPRTEECRADPLYDNIGVISDPRTFMARRAAFNRLLSGLFYEPHLRARTVDDLREEAVLGDAEQRPKLRKHLSKAAASFVIAAFARGPDA